MADGRKMQLDKNFQFPAVCRVNLTSVNEWTNVDTDVAAGSHLENGIWALFVIAATRMQNCRLRKSKMADGRHFDIVKVPYLNEQEAQLSKRDRATLRLIEYFAKSLKVTQGHSKWQCWVGRV